MSLLHQYARRIRHAPLLARADKFWRALRPAYHKLIDPAGRGVTVRVGRAHRLRVPASLTSVIGGWAEYEPECVAATIDWIRAHPNGVMLDLGCSIGMFSALPFRTTAWTAWTPPMPFLRGPCS